MAEKVEDHDDGRGVDIHAGRWLGLLYAALFLVYGVHLPYWPAWLAAHGLSPAGVGTVLAATFLLRAVVAPIGAAWAGRAGDVRPTLRMLAAVAAVGFVVAGLTEVGAVAGSVLTIATVAVMIPLTPLVDSLAIDHARGGRVVYGRVRVVGSVAFVGANLLGGALLARAGVGALPWWLAAAGFAVLACALRVPAPPQPSPSIDAGAAALRGSWLAEIPRVARLPGVLRGVLAASLVQSSHGVYYALGTIHWQRLGLGGDRIGQLWALAVCAEIVLFAKSGLVERLAAPRYLIAAGAVLGAARWAVIAADPPLALLVPVQLLHAASFGATHLGAMAFIARRVPPGSTATAQGIYAALASGLLMGLVILVAGPLYQRVGGHTYLLGAAAALAALFVLPGAARASAAGRPA